MWELHSPILFKDWVHTWQQFPTHTSRTSPIEISEMYAYKDAQDYDLIRGRGNMVFRWFGEIIYVKSKC